jgi:vancomycin resistance protein VanJ
LCRFSEGASLAYLLGIVLVWAVSRLVAEAAWWGTLLLYPPQVFYLGPAAATLPLSLVVRSGRAIGLNLAAAAVVLGPMMGLCVGGALGTPPSGARVRVLEYNIEAAEAGVETVVAKIREADPDVAVLCEARRSPRRPSLPPELSSGLKGWHTASAGEVFIASRWPIARADRRPLPESIDRKLLRVRIDAPFGPLYAVAAHMSKAMQPGTPRRQKLRLPSYLALTGRGRAEQVKAVLDFATGLDAPVLLAGDFNTPPVGRIYGALARRFGDSFAEAGRGWGYTYPARYPLLRIDYIFHSRDWRATAARVGSRPGSDHRALFAELVLTR